MRLLCQRDADGDGDCDSDDLNELLGDFGCTAVGSLLMDEKLGMHVAFGRSEHFGGQVGPERFSRPSAVIHQDHVYLPQLQPRIAVGCATLHMADGSRNVIMESGRYRIDFEAS